MVMKHYKTSKKTREAALKYYYEHRKEILAKYKSIGNGKCKICGKKLENMPTRMFRYCDECINNKEKVSRQTRWYRQHSCKTLKKGGSKC